MNKSKIRTYGSDTLPLLTLRLVLTDARRNVPPSVSKIDMTEELAAKLIEKLRRQYKRYIRLIN